MTLLPPARPHGRTRSGRLALVAVLAVAPGTALSVLSPASAHAGDSGGSSSGQGGGDKQVTSRGDAANDAADALADAADARADALADAADDRARARRDAAEGVAHAQPAHSQPADAQPAEPERRAAPAPAAAAPAAVVGARTAVVRARPAVVRSRTTEPAPAGARTEQQARPTDGATTAATAAPPARPDVPPVASAPTDAADGGGEGGRIERASVPLVGTTLGEVSPAAVGRATAVAGAGLLALLGLYGVALQASRSLRRPPE